MTTPKRIQRKRVKGFDLQAVSVALNGLPAVSVTRPGQFGNPFKVGIWFNNISGDWWFCSFGDSSVFGEHQVESLIHSLELFKEYAEARAGRNPQWLESLRGKNLACWCPPGSHCHADTLLRLANLPDAARGEK